MKLPRCSMLLIVAGLCFCGFEKSIAALLFSADSKTVTADNGDASSSPLTPRLFLDNGFLNAAPLGTTIWFVADVNHDGVPATAGGSSQVPLSMILGADDVLLHSDVLDGDQPGSIAGVYRRLGIQINGDPQNAAALSGANIYAYLWNGSGVNFAPTDGSTFGVQDLGIHPPPQFGNAFWAIDQNMSASQFTVSAVPELPAGIFAVAFLAVVILARNAFDRIAFVNRRART
jgi:hypothetical protein